MLAQPPVYASWTSKNVLESHVHLSLCQMKGLGAQGLFAGVAKENP
jgi:hypothetical protein